MPVATMRAQWGDSRCTPIYIYVQTSGGGNRAECHLLVLGFYCYHELKWYLKSVCAKTFDDVILDLWVEVLIKRRDSNACHTVRDVDAGQGMAI